MNDPHKRRAWNRTRLTNLLCLERDMEPSEGWVSIYQTLGYLSSEQLAHAVRAAAKREIGRLKGKK